MATGTIAMSIALILLRGLQLSPPPSGGGLIRPGLSFPTSRSPGFVLWTGGRPTGQRRRAAAASEPADGLALPPGCRLRQPREPVGALTRNRSFERWLAFTQKNVLRRLENPRQNPKSIDDGCLPSRSHRQAGRWTVFPGRASACAGGELGKVAAISVQPLSRGSGQWWLMSREGSKSSAPKLAGGLPGSVPGPQDTAARPHSSHHVVD